MTQFGVEPQLKHVEEIRAVNDHSVSIITHQPSPLLLNDLVFVPIIPADTPLSPVETVIGTGPYRLTSGSAGGALTLVRFEQYWDAPPEFERVRIVPVASDAARAALVANGEADLVVFPEAHWAEQPNPKDFRLMKREGLAVTFLALVARPGSPFGDRQVRRAVARALDRTALAQDALSGLAVPIDQLVPRGVLGFMPDLQPARADAAGAAAILARANLKNRPLGLLAPAVHERVAREVALQLAAVGLTLEPKILPWKQFLEQLPKAESEAEVRSVSSTTGDALDVLSMLHTPGAAAAPNHYGYSNPELDLLLEKAATTLDPADRVELLHRAMAIAREDAVLIPLLARYRLYALRRGLSWSPRLDGRVLAQHVHLAQG